MTSIYQILDLLERVDNSSHYEDKILTTAGVLADFAVWTYVWAQDSEGAGATSFLPWLRREARKYEASVDDSSAAEPGGWHGIAPEDYERGKR